MRWKYLLIGLALLLYLGPAVALAYEEYNPLSDPAQRGIEAVKIAALKENPCVTTWGYDYPYSMAYGMGVPRYTGHNYGMPTGAIYEYPSLYPYGTPDPYSVYGDPENALLMNFGYSFPFHDGTTSVWY
jgi:hypothetical protein